MFGFAVFAMNTCCVAIVEATHSMLTVGTFAAVYVHLEKSLNFSSAALRRRTRYSRISAS